MDKVLRNVIIFSGIVLVIAIIAVIMVYKPISLTSQSSAGNNVLTGNNAANNAGTATTNTANAGEVQNVKLSVSGGTYVLTPSVLKKGVPVRMVADLSTVRGCSRDVVISAFGVRKYVSEGDNIITFTPTTTGTINIACSMNMYRGTFTVV